MNDAWTRGRAAVEQLPASIRVGAYDYTIDKWPGQNHNALKLHGHFSGVEQSIGLQLDLPSPAKAVEVFIHEVNHAIYYVFNADDADTEERLVKVFAIGWLCVYRDNPWLLDWLKEAVT